MYLEKLLNLSQQIDRLNASLLAVFIDKNKKRQYNLYLNNGGSMTIEQWEMDGRYDASDWGEL